MRDLARLSVRTSSLTLHFFLSRSSFPILGYALGEVKQASSGFGFTAPLSLNGEACNAYGVDIQNLTLAVVREKPHQLHVHIYDTARNQYQLPLDEIFTRPDSDPETIQGGASEEESDLVFNHSDQAPFEFWISRKDGGEVIFDTRKANIPTYDDPLEGSVASKRNTTAMPAHEMIVSLENCHLVFHVLLRLACLFLFLSLFLFFCSDTVSVFPRHHTVVSSPSSLSALPVREPVSSTLICSSKGCLYLWTRRILLWIFQKR